MLNKVVSFHNETHTFFIKKSGHELLLKSSIEILYKSSIFNCYSDSISLLISIISGAKG